MNFHLLTGKSKVQPFRKKASSVLIMILISTMITMFSASVVLADTSLISSQTFQPMVSGGVAHSLYLKDGIIYAWGSNDSGQLGDNTNITHFMPVQIRGFNGKSIKQVVAGTYYSLAVDSEGNVWAWGNNAQGQLGDGSQTNRNYPVQIAGLGDVTAVAAGTAGSLALKKDGTVWQWGEGSQLTPAQITELTDIEQIAAGEHHYVVLKKDGSVWTWGKNNNGQLGIGSFEDSAKPVQVQGLGSGLQISSGLDHTLVLAKDGSVYSWGANDAGKLGNENTLNQALPQRVKGLDSNVVKVSAGYFHNLALTSEDQLMAWGTNYYSLLGDESAGDYRAKAMPVKFTEGLPILNFAAGGYHNLVVSSYDPYSNQIAVYSWGLNDAGQLGDGTVFHEAALTQAVVFEPQFIFHRIAGKDRIQTAVAVSREGWFYGAETVVLSRDDDFPDALTGVTLADAYYAPILLTNKQTISPQTREEIARLQPKKIILLGSTGALSQEIEDELAKSYQVIRLGGQNRYETASAIARQLKENNLLKTDKAVIAYGQNFPDALAVSSLAAYQKIPILLTETRQLPEATQNSLTELGIKETIIVGGTGVIGNEVEGVLPAPIRYAGADRYATALEIARQMNADSSLIYVATGKDFPDALAGAAFAAWTNSPIVLVDKSLPDGFWTNYNVIPKHEIMVLGGPGVVPVGVFNEFNQAFPLREYSYSLVD